MIPREAEKTMKKLAKRYPVVTVTGPRQSGKTTLVRTAFPKMDYVSLEEPDTLDHAKDDPRDFLKRYDRGAIIDEAQRCPELFSYLQTKVDLEKKMGAYVLTGSQQFGLMSGITQSLAGRTGIIQLLPFSMKELRSAEMLPKSLNDLLFRGLYPPLYDREMEPSHFLSSYVMTYVERDVRNLIHVRDLSQFQRFLRMCAARTGQLLNLNSLASDCGITHNTARSWISVLEASYIVFLLQPHHNNFGKRLVKTPKLYFYDTGLAAFLLNIQGLDHISIHPQRGGLFESFVVSEYIKSRFNRGLAPDCYFWRNNTGDEIDLILDRGINLDAVEIKSGATINPDFFSGFERWVKISGGDKGSSTLIYGGTSSMQRKGVSVLAWEDVDFTAI